MKTRWRVLVEVIEFSEDGTPHTVVNHDRIVPTNIDPERITLNDRDVLQDIADCACRSMGRLLRGRS